MPAKRQKKTLIRHHVKHWLVPHKHNDHRPHLIRTHGLAVLALLVLGVHASAYALTSAPTPLTTGSVLGYATNITPIDLFNLTNQERTSRGLPAFTLNAKLNNAAYLKGQNMFAENYWAHVSPSGKQPWYWFTQAGYAYSYAGENLAKDFATSAGTVAGWMASPGHQANILNAHYTEVGFSVQDGTLVGGQTTLVVAHYALPATPSTPAPAAAATPKPAVKSNIAATPTPVATATRTPELSPSPSPTATPTDSPVPPDISGTVEPAPPPQNYGLFKPLSIGETLGWSTKVTIGLMILLFIIYVWTHLTVWRKGLARWRSTHYRLYASGQVSGLAIAITMLATSGFGKVG
jgi:hypothetical protein